MFWSTKISYAMDNNTTHYEIQSTRSNIVTFDSSNLVNKQCSEILQFELCDVHFGRLNKYRDVNQNRSIRLLKSCFKNMNVRRKKLTVTSNNKYWIHSYMRQSMVYRFNVTTKMKWCMGILRMIQDWTNLLRDVV